MLMSSFSLLQQGRRLGAVVVPPRLQQRLSVFAMRTLVGARVCGRRGTAVQASAARALLQPVLPSIRPQVATRRLLSFKRSPTLCSSSNGTPPSQPPPIPIRRPPKSERRRGGAPNEGARKGAAEGQEPSKQRKLFSSKEGVVVYESDRGRFFRLLSFTCAAQTVFWLSASTLAIEAKDKTDDGDYVESSVQTRYGLTAACLAMASIFAFLGIVIPRRYVCRLKVMGRDVSIQTYTTFSKRAFKVPIRDLNMSNVSTEAKQLMPFRIKGKSMYYMLDGRAGKFSHLPHLYPLLGR